MEFIGDVADCIQTVAKRNGTVNVFPVLGEIHYEVTIGLEVYGPMVETELFWFTKGMLANEG